MTWVVNEQRVVLQAIASTDTVQNHPFGTIVKAKDGTYGAGEFIYLQGCSGGFAGALVTYVNTTGVTELSKTSGVVRGGAPLAVMMSALSATTLFGWCQIEGDALVYKTAVKFDPATNTNVYLSATAGRIMQTSVAGRQVLGARWTSTTTVTSTTSTAVITLNRPSQKSGTAI
jgi:hypothetical protein